jgi:hypothetical protein
VQGLSCYTAALHGYLAVEWDASSVIARSVRLAVQVDPARRELAFSHHQPSLDVLPDGSRLVYTECPSSPDALPELAAELARYGRVVAVADSARLPWSVTRGGSAAPHWLLIDGRDERGWHVRDDFAALLPTGEQTPYQGWLSADELTHAMALPPCWQPTQVLRNQLAFGVPVRLGAAGALWLRREHGSWPPRILPVEEGWLVGDAQVLPFLIEYAAEAGLGIIGHLEDLWAAAGHRSFAYRWQLHQAGDEGDRTALEAALSHWEALPRLLRVAVESVARGRPRPTLVRSALLRLQDTAS